jgi:hypothetical protein
MNTRAIIASAWAVSFAPKPLALDQFGRPDPGMRVRSDLIRSGLPIDEAGNAITEETE